MTDDEGRRVPAPELAEVAAAWWDRDVVPWVAWDAVGRSFALVEGVDAIPLLTLRATADDPRALAEVLAGALAACDFPPTADGPTPALVARTLAANGVAAEVEGA